MQDLVCINGVCMWTDLALQCYQWARRVYRRVHSNTSHMLPNFDEGKSFCVAVHIPLGYVAKINIPWPWPWPWVLPCALWEGGHRHWNWDYLRTWPLLQQKGECSVNTFNSPAQWNIITHVALGVGWRQNHTYVESIYIYIYIYIWTTSNIISSISHYSVDENYSYIYIYIYIHTHTHTHRRLTFQESPLLWKKTNKIRVPTRLTHFVSFDSWFLIFYAIFCIIYCDDTKGNNSFQAPRKLHTTFFHHSLHWKCCTIYARYIGIRNNFLCLRGFLLLSCSK